MRGCGQSAVIEDLDYRHPRGLDKALMNRLITGQWIKKKLNLLITGPTGVGKTWNRVRPGQQGLAATASPFSTVASRGCSTSSATLTATGAIRR